LAERRPVPDESVDNAGPDRRHFVLEREMRLVTNLG
jgi:hypothetical protein